jgi:hypothetical protein
MRTLIAQLPRENDRVIHECKTRVDLMQSAIGKEVFFPEQRRMVSYESEADFRYDNRSPQS